MNLDELATDRDGVVKREALVTTSRDGVDEAPDRIEHDGARRPLDVDVRNPRLQRHVNHREIVRGGVCNVGARFSLDGGRQKSKSSGGQNQRRGPADVM
jgi:hypothetical protein